MFGRARSFCRKSPWCLTALSIALTCVLLSVAACEDLGSGATTSEVDLAAMTTTPEETSATAAPATESSSTSTSSSTTSSDSTTTTGGFLPIIEAEINPESIVLPLAWTKYESTDSDLAWLGQWYTGFSAQMSGNSYRYTNANHAGVLIDFEGTQIRLICLKNSAQGKAEFTVDGEPSVLVDLYNSTSSPQQIVWTSDVLDNEHHSLLIGWTGVKNSSSSNTYINVDAIEVKGTLE